MLESLRHQSRASERQNIIKRILQKLLPDYDALEDMQSEEEAQSVNLDELLDNTARNDNIAEASADDQNRSLDENGEWLVMMGVCTHLGWRASEHLSGTVSPLDLGIVHKDDCYTRHRRPLEAATGSTKALRAPLRDI